MGGQAEGTTLEPLYILSTSPLGSKASVIRQFSPQIVKTEYFRMGQVPNRDRKAQVI